MKFVRAIFIAIMVMLWQSMLSQEALEYEATILGNGSSGENSPYYIASNNHGLMPQKSSALGRVALWQKMDLSSRFSYGFGADVIGGWCAGADYMAYNNETQQFYAHRESPANIWIQQLYCEIKYRGVFLTAGLKEYDSAMLNNELSSGDLIQSGNSRPIPEARMGFVDFQNIPFTHGWVQIQGEISYGKTTDSDWLEKRYNYYNRRLAVGTWYTYKRCYFRTNPHQPLSIIIGAQAAGQFRGTTYRYSGGQVYETDVREPQFRDFFDMFIPKSGEEGYVKGNHLGSWDFQACYKLKNNDELKAYFQWPWEDGSGIGKLNGFDGLWGIEYRRNNRGVVNGIVLEYLDFTNQSGPIHWDSEDNVGTTIVGTDATGADNYYNNMNYNGYAHYGMSIGSPMFRSPIYNYDGLMEYADNRFRGFHVGIMGNINPRLEYRVLGSYRKSWGTIFIPRVTPVDCTSAMVEMKYTMPTVEGLKFKAQVAFDQGALYGDNFGAMLSVSYHGNFSKCK